jgi:hypothetical protein
MISYTYSILRYVHDPAAGETLNVGVVLYSPAAQYLEAMVDTRYERLSRTFANFDGEQYRQALRRFEVAIDRLREQELGSLPLAEVPQSISDFTHRVWPDQDLSFRLGPVFAGVADRADEELVAIFDRMILSQYPRDEKERRTDEDVWSVYKRPLQEEAIIHALQPKTIQTPDFNLTFEYAFQNKNWHALQPMSLDYSRAESIQRKAAQWLGNCTALEGQDELRTVYFLLGEPQLQSHRLAYEKAKSLLHKAPLTHEIIEEDAAGDFAVHLRNYMRDHGILKSE